MTEGTKLNGINLKNLYSSTTHDVHNLTSFQQPPNEVEKSMGSSDSTDNTRDEGYEGNTDGKESSKTGSRNAKSYLQRELRT